VVVAQEHFASAFVREKLAEMIGELDTGVAPGPEGVCAGAPGDQHELGLMACAVRLASAGWKVLYLGADVPMEDIRRIVDERRPALLCSSVVMRQDAGAFRAFAQRLRGAAPRETAVVIGGAGIPAEAEPVDGVRFARCVGEIFSAN
jgi:methanogenic corrinoid protein MtbC1